MIVVDRDADTDAGVVAVAGTASVVSWRLGLALLMLVGLLLFAHGCHGDEDHELWSLTSTARQ